MSQYYYLIASLPALRWENPPPYGQPEFRVLCKGHLNAGDYAFLLEARLDADPVSHPLLREWRKADFGLRNELARLRAKKLNVEAEPHLHPEYLDVLQAPRAQEILDAGDPLKTEMLLNRVRWARLNELETGHYFDLGFLLVYCLKMQILERNASFKPNIGQQKLELILQGETTHG
jgi:hypothetical protein